MNPPKLRGRFPPILAPLAAQRSLALLVSVTAAIQLGVVLAGGSGVGCPLHDFTGIPCPGCGLTRATVLLLRGQWRASLEAHAFASLFLVTVIFLLGVSVLPGERHREIVEQITRMEQRWGLGLIGGVGLVLYWMVRLGRSCG